MINLRSEDQVWMEAFWTGAEFPTNVEHQESPRSEGVDAAAGSAAYDSYDAGL